MSGNLLGSLKQIHDNTNINYVSNTKIEITAFNLTRKDGYDCDIGSYDHCVAQQRLLQNSNCFLPFDLGQHNDENVCKTHEEGLNVSQEMLTLSKRCKPSCFQIDVKYKEEPEHYLLVLARPELVTRFVEAARDELGYIYQIPKEIRIFSNTHEYTAPVALGYFGSIVGIFIGVSFLSIVEFTIDFFHVNKLFKRWILNVSKIGISMYLLALFVMLLMKFLQYPVANSINFEKTNSNFSISICSLPYTFLSKELWDYTLFAKDSNLFGKKWRNVSTMIDSMTMNNGTHDIDLIADQYKNSRYSSILPYNNNTVAICNTFDLSQHNAVNKIHLVYNTEIEVYFHLKDQFLYEWLRKKTKFLPSSSKNVRIFGDMIEVLDTHVFVNVELKQSISSESFDDWLNAEGRTLFGSQLVEDYLNEEFKNISLNQEDIVRFENISKFMHNVTFCPTPDSYMNVKVSQSNYLTSITMKISNKEMNTQSSLNEELGLTNLKPSVTLEFSSFTKISQVSPQFFFIYLQLNAF